MPLVLGGVGQLEVDQNVSVLGMLMRRMEVDLRASFGHADAAATSFHGQFLVIDGIGDSLCTLGCYRF